MPSSPGGTRYKAVFDPVCSGAVFGGIERRIRLAKVAGRLAPRMPQLLPMQAADARIWAAAPTSEFTSNSVFLLYLATL